MSSSEADVIRVGRYARIGRDELWFEHARSGGPGGQNVNKVSTRVTLRFDLEGSPSLTPTQKARIRARLAGRINRAGTLRVVSSKHRTQAANRRATLERFVELLEQALHVQKPRRPTAVPVAAKRRRQAEKTRRAQVKEARAWRYRGDQQRAAGFSPRGPSP